MAIIVGVRRYKPASRGPWRWFALGMLLFWLGDLYTYSYPRLFNADVPFPSLGDGAYVAVYPALMAGLLMLIRRRNPESDRAGVIDSLIMTLGLALLSWVALIAPYLHDETMTVTGKLVSVAYPLGDILLLAAAIRLAVDTGKRLPAFYLLASAIVISPQRRGRPQHPLARVVNQPQAFGQIPRVPKRNVGVIDRMRTRQHAREQCHHCREGERRHCRGGPLTPDALGTTTSDPHGHSATR